MASPAPPPVDSIAITPLCPAEGTVSGTITPAEVLAQTALGIDAGQFEELVRALRAGAAYANVQSSLFSPAKSAARSATPTEIETKIKVLSLAARFFNFDRRAKYVWEPGVRRRRALSFLRSKKSMGLAAVTAHVHFCPSSAITSLTKRRSMYSAGFRLGFVFNAMACHCAINSTPFSVGTGTRASLIIW